MKENENDILIVYVYVDDIIILGYYRFKKSMADEFEMSN